MCNFPVKAILFIFGVYTMYGMMPYMYDITYSWHHKAAYLDYWWLSDFFMMSEL